LTIANAPCGFLFVADSRRFIVIQHLAAEGPGLIATVARNHGFTVDVRRMDRGDAVPAADALDGLVVLGGTMAATDVATYPHLAAEQRLLASACARDVPVLAVCLGAQLLAAALGARVFKGPAAEIGFGAVTLTPDGADDPILGPSGPGFPAFHWHGDTFDLPRGAVHLAASAAYAHQAFRFGTRAYGLQFHVELDRPLAREWAAALPAGVKLDEKRRAAVEQTGRAILHRFFSELPLA
jgi:GMP synthase (glutamine-hydrolysing)